jgi:hypothetical protein
MGRLGRLALSFCCSFGGDSSRWSDSYTSAGKLDLALLSGEGSLTRTQGMGREGIWFVTFGLYKRGEREGARKGEGNREPAFCVHNPATVLHTMVQELRNGNGNGNGR